MESTLSSLVVSIIVEMRVLMTAPGSQDVGSMASLYSQIAGVLAGFGFAAFTLFLTIDKLPSNAGAIAASQFSAFAGLILVAILYALLAGEPSPQRKAMGVLLYGLPFGLAVITMFETLTLLALSRAGLSSSVTIGRTLVLVVGPAFLLARLMIASRYVSPVSQTSRLAYVAGCLLVAALVITGLFTMLFASTTPWRQYSAWAAHMGLILAVAAAASSSWLTTRSPSYGVNKWYVRCYLALSFIMLMIYVALAGAALASDPT
jgi:hypothetical protein